jgi:hypothetical protein
MCENFMKVIFGTKDTISTREYLQKCGIWSYLWLQHVTGKIIKPIASYVMLKEEKHKFLQIVGNLKHLPTMCFVKEESPQGWGYERDEIT